MEPFADGSCAPTTVHYWLSFILIRFRSSAVVSACRHAIDKLQRMTSLADHQRYSCMFSFYHSQLRSIYLLIRTYLSRSLSRIVEEPPSISTPDHKQRYLTDRIHLLFRNNAMLSTLNRVRLCQGSVPKCFLMRMFFREWNGAL